MVNWPHFFNRLLGRVTDRVTTESESSECVTQCQPPVNFRSRDTSPEAITQDVEYALRIGEEYLALIVAEGVSPMGRAIFELGPGVNFGSLMLLACHGAKPVVADRFLVSWNDDYHRAFYEGLRLRLKAKYPLLDVQPIDILLRANSHHPEVIKCVSESGERLRGVATQSVDVTLSNAVLEHLEHPPTVFGELARITKAGGIGLHQVDFRDHRDFSQPLEYLLLDPVAFAEMFAERHGECGGQWRPQQFTALFRAAGFEVLRFDPNIFAEDSYFDGFMPRLKEAKNSLYCDYPRGQLAATSGRFYLRR
jgi:hypothetical protein